jgi:hypothetical protein
LKVLLDKKSIVRSQSASLPRNSAALLSLQEGFQLFESDLSKLQVSKSSEISFTYLCETAIHRVECHRLREGAKEMG